MTKKEFDNYKFSIKTLVLFQNKWQKVLSVNFPIRQIETKDFLVDCAYIDDIY